MTKKDVIKILKELMPTLKSNYNVKKIGIFGSYSKETQNNYSDIDLVIYFNKPLGLKYINLVDFLENHLGKNVDIITEQGLKHIRVKRTSDSIKKDVTYV